MNFEQFMTWARSLPFYKGWNIHFSFDFAASGESSFTFMATLKDQCHRYTRKSLEQLELGITNHIKRIEESNASEV